MNKLKVIRPLVLFSLFGGLVVTGSLFRYSQAESVHAEQTLSGDNFISVDDFLYSGKGLQMEFSFEVPKTNATNRFSFIQETPGNWLRLTKQFELNFKSDGTVTTNMGKVFNIENKYYYQILFKELDGYLNLDDKVKPTGHETLNLMYFSTYNVSFESRSCTVISSEINAYPKAEIRDGSINGLRFKSHLNSLNSSSVYGHIIVPNHYVSKYDSDYVDHLIEDEHKYLEIPCTPKALSETDELYQQFGAGYSITASIVNISPDNYQLPYCAIPYEKLSDGTYNYGNFVRGTKSTLYDACVNEKESGAYLTRTYYGQSFIDNVIASCDVHETPITSLRSVSAFAAKNSEQIEKSTSITGDEPKVVELEAGRNEQETGQIMLYSTDCESNYYVNFEPFVSSTSSYIISSDNVSIYKELYLNADSNWSQYDKIGGPYVDGKESLPLGWFPDALLPFELSIDSGENYLSRNNGNMNGIYFSIDIPKDTPAGIYTSNAIIRIRGEGTIVMPIKLKVCNFTLPDQNHSNTIIPVSTTELGYLYKNTNVSFDSSYYKTAYDLLENNGVSGGQLPTSRWSKSELSTFIENCKKYAADPSVSTYLLPDCYQSMDLDISFTYLLGIRSVTQTLENMPIYVGKDYVHEEGGKQYQMYGLETLFTEMVKASTNDVDLLKKGVFYFPQADEPGNDLADQLQNVICQHVVLTAAKNVLANESLFVGKESVKQSLENINYFVTSQPKGFLKGVYKYNGTEYSVSLSSIAPISENCGLAYLSSNIDDFYKDSDGTPLIHMRSYCPQYDCYQYYNGGVNTWGYQDITNMLNDDEYTMWWYGCCMPVAPYPCNAVNAPVVRFRVNKWLQFKYGVKGEMNYMCNRASSVISDKEGKEYSTPKTEEEILNGLADYNGIHGDGTWIYPVHDMYKNIDPTVYWLPTIRLKILSEGADDYNYLHYARELINKLPSSERAVEEAKIDEYISSLTTGTYYNSKDHNVLYNQKDNLANLIVSLEARI